MQTIALGTDYPVAVALTSQPDPTVPAIAATGMNDVHLFLADHPGGTPIDASLNVDATESNSTPGTYVGTLAGADLTAHLVTRVGRTVYLCVQVETVLNEATPFRVAWAA